MEVKQVNVKQGRYRQLWQHFLQENDVHGFSDADLAAIDTTCLWFDDQGELIATGSVAGQVLKYLAISAHHREGGAFFNTVVSHLTELAAQRGHFHLFVFTKPQYVTSFTHVASHCSPKRRKPPCSKRECPRSKITLARSSNPHQARGKWRRSL